MVSRCLTLLSAWKLVCKAVVWISRQVGAPSNEDMSETTTSRSLGFVPSVSRTELEAAQVLQEIRFHNLYLNCDLEFKGIRKLEFSKGQRIYGIVDQEEIVLFPGEVQPLVLPVGALNNDNLVIAVSAGRLQNNNLDARLATVAQIVAVAAVRLELETIIVIVRGETRVKFKQESADDGEIVEVLEDCDFLDVPLGANMYSYYARMMKEEVSMNSMTTCSKDLPLSETTRLSFYREPDSLVRRAFIRQVKKMRSLPIYCKLCLDTTGEFTIILRDARLFRSKATCVNPGGYIFHMLLYSDENVNTSTVMSVGPAHIEHSWFSGYSWSYCLCRRCNSHLGWRYQPKRSNATGSSFWGLRSTSFFHHEELLRAELILR